MRIDPPILLTGVTGYVGSRLRLVLEHQKVSIRCLVRRPEFSLQSVHPTTELVTGDALNAPSLQKALKGIHTTFYLMNSRGVGRDSEIREYEAAKIFAHACFAQKVQKIIYLGSLGSGRQKVGEILMASGIPVVEFRASLIIGSGSPAFEILRALVERLPFVVLPRWVDTHAQPIAIEDILDYLMEAIRYRGPSRVFEIGGPERVSYRELMKEVARQRGLRRWIWSVPIRGSRFSRLGLKWFLSLDSHAARRAVENLEFPAVVTHPLATQVFRVRPRSCDQSIELSLREGLLQ